MMSVGNGDQVLWSCPEFLGDQSWFLLAGSTRGLLIFMFSPSARVDFYLFIFVTAISMKRLEVVWNWQG